jgi:hypothetical protein
MKKLMLAAALFASSLAFAGTGQGSVSCNQDQDLVAIYTWFHSEADSWATVTVFGLDRSDAKLKYKQLQAFGDQALAPLTVRSANGRQITVTPDVQNEKCTIEEK